MAKDVNLYSQEWCDIVFEGKNQEYGAYTIRRTTSKRHIIALISILIVAIFVAALPTLIAKVGEIVARTISEGLTEKTVLAELEDMKEEIENQALKQEAPPPPPLKSTIKFTPPVITSSEEMDDENSMKSMEELIESKLQISIADVQGTDEKGAVDIADLKEHKTIVQEEEEIFQIVEQMPEFPGGMEELYALIRKKIDYPQQARDYGIQGTTLVKFSVSKDGSVSNVSVLVSAHPILDKEAVRVVQSLPKWIPGKMNGKNVSCWYQIPIVFKIY